MPYKDIVKRRAVVRAYRNKNLEKERARCRQWKLDHGDEYRERAKTRKQKVRRELLDYLGGKCVRCGFKDWRALQVDHINGDGSRDRKRSDGEYFAKKIFALKKDEALKRYQVLCANCNWIKRYENNEINMRYRK